MKEEPLPISLVAHTVFCPRRAWLEAAGESTPSVAIEHGVAAHATVDTRQDDRRRARRSVDVTDPESGLVGRCDVVADEGDGLRIIEYKSSPLRRRADVTTAQRVQLALQAMCLESMGHRVVGGAVYFTNHRKEVRVEIDEELRAEARGFIELTRDIVESATAPEPLLADPRCRLCSHVGICLPEERQEARITHSIKVREPDGETLHLTTPGARASLAAGRVVVQRADDKLASVPIELVASLVIHGNVDVSSALVRELLWRGIPLTWCSGRGAVVGYARSTRSPNGAVRVAQRSPTADTALALAREFIATKIANQATQLRRSTREPAQDHVDSIRHFSRRAGQALSTTELLGIEGEAAAIYFGDMPQMLAVPARDPFSNEWPGREGRGALDPLNVSLNFAYGLLAGQTLRALVTCGLDPHAGVLHSAGRNKPAMALDLMEEFRAPRADAVVIGAINNGEFTATMLTSVLGGSRLREDGRQALVRAFERRLDQSIRHPVFGYAATWRRILDVQARMVLGVLDGSQNRYVGVRIK